MTAAMRRSLGIALSLCLAQVCFGSDAPPTSKNTTKSAPNVKHGANAIESHRATWEQFIDAGPNPRTYLYVYPYVRELEAAYSLDATQSATVRARIEKVAADRRQQMGSLSNDYDAAANQAAGIWWQFREAAKQADDSPRSLGSFRDDPTYQNARQRMLEIEKQFPIDWDAVLDDVEAVLPPQQASRGRNNMYKNRFYRAARIARRQARLAEPLAKDDARRIAARNADPSSRTVAVREALKQAEHKIESGNLPPEAKAQLRRTIQRTRRKLQKPADRPPATPAIDPAIARDLDRWEAYTRDFIAKRKLSEQQQTAALSIMTRLRDRAKALRQSFARREQETKPADRAKLADQRTVVDQRIADLFDQLVKRLDALLTTEQRRAVLKPDAKPVKR